MRRLLLVHVEHDPLSRSTAAISSPSPPALNNPTNIARGYSAARLLRDATSEPGNSSFENTSILSHRHPHASTTNQVPSSRL